MSVREVLDQHGSFIDSLVSWYEAELRDVVASAQARTLADLQLRLQISNGKIARTAANQRVLRQVDDFLAAAMERAGFYQLTDEFVRGFNGHFQYFERVLDAISENLKTPLKVQFSKSDTALFESQQLSTLESLSAVVDTVAAAAKKKALFSVGALPFTDLAEHIATTFGRSVGEASTLAETSTTMFYRTISDRGFQQIEAGLPKGAIKYRFEGPRDKLTRPFCKRLLTRTRSEPLTRAQIEVLDNGQLPNPFVSGGGFLCRHNWIIAAIR
ncbi:MAG: hypothetical protein IT168_33250 [Bryobacterales bacterium]|nr:hypothetical protein [Bryobacterales bacterium]